MWLTSLKAITKFVIGLVSVQLKCEKSQLELLICRQQLSKPYKTKGRKESQTN